MDNSNARIVDADQLNSFIASAFEACGMPRGNAARMANLMAEADIGGQDGHGVFRLPQYIKRIQ